MLFLPTTMPVYYGQQKKLKKWHFSEFCKSLFNFIYSEIPILLSCDLNTEYFILWALKFHLINQRKLIGQKYRNVTITC